MSGLTVPPAVRELLDAARCTVVDQDGGLRLAEGEGEVRYTLLDVDGWRLERIDRGAAPMLEIAAPLLDDVYRFLMVELGPVARAFRDLAPRVFPTFARNLATGFDREVDDDGVVVLQDGRERARFRPEDPFGVSRSTDFTHYADLPLERIGRLVLTTTATTD